MSFSQFTDYLLLEKKYSSHTIVAYSKDLESFLNFYKDSYEESGIACANYSQIRSWIVLLVDQGVSNRSINRKISSLKAYYRFLLKTGQIEKTPLAKHKALKVSKKIQIPFSEKEIQSVIEVLCSGDKNFKTIRDLLIVELFYATGIRRAELVDLKLRDVDVGNGQIKVLGKRNKERFVPLLPSVIDVLEEYLLFRSQVLKNETEYLLLTEKGVKIYETLVYRIINGYFSRVSVKVKRSPHILRHSFATHLLNEGANLNAVKELLGHSSLAATEVYTHQSITQLNKVYKQSHPRNKK